MADTDDDALADAKEAFRIADDAENDNRERAEADLRFSRLGEQWDDLVKLRREDDKRPMLTLNKTLAFVRQVVNDARLNKPAIKVRPADSTADIDTADILNGLIRNIEYTSDADIAYDTAVDYAVSMGWGYFRIGVDYATDDTFDLDISIDSIANPFNVYGDPHSTAKDSSDWNSAFVTNSMTTDEFETTYKDAEQIDWQSDRYSNLGSPWMEDETVMVAEYWTREEVPSTIWKMSDGSVLRQDFLEAQHPNFAVPRWQVFAARGVQPVDSRDSRRHLVTQRVMNGAEVLSSREWPGRFIPLVPVYGDDIDFLGKRYLFSLIYASKDAQRMYNYWRSAATELAALAPKAPFVGPEKAFQGIDANKWATANTRSYPFLSYKGDKGPERQPLGADTPMGAIAEALSANDDMKSILGIYDPALGNRSNEIAGVAINARKAESDVSNFHFIDNLTRSIRHGGRIIIDLIPHIYSAPRMIRVLGEDGKPTSREVNQPTSDIDEQGKPITDERGLPVMRVFDLTAGKYDLTVSAGPAFSTRREESAQQMMDLLKAFPQAAPVIGDLIAKNLDWPGADELADRLKQMLPPELRGEDDELPPQIMQMIEQGGQMIEALQGKVTELEADKAIDTRKVEIDAYEAETGRLKVAQDSVDPEAIKMAMWQAVVEILGGTN